MSSLFQLVWFCLRLQKLLKCVSAANLLCIKFYPSKTLHLFSYTIAHFLNSKSVVNVVNYFFELVVFPRRFGKYPKSFIVLFALSSSFIVINNKEVISVPSDYFIFQSGFMDLPMMFCVFIYGFIGV